MSEHARLANIENTPLLATMMESTSKHLQNILDKCFQHTNQQSVVVVYDLRCELSVALAKAYQLALLEEPKTQFIDFDQTTPEDILAILAALQSSDLVILIQTTNFRMDAFRIRVELFKRGLKVIEHPHLGRMPNEEAAIYLESLAYDADYYRGVGRALQEKINAASMGIVDSGGEQLIYASPFESAKVNIGDYTGMPNMGGQFPIGEVFTEAKDLEAVNGRVRIHVFGDTSFSVNRPEKPITLVINKGQVTEVIDSTPEFDIVIDNIIKDEGVVWLRELGFGINRAFTKDRMVSDIGTYERMCGIHLSLGAKHGIYAKPNFKRGDGKYHVDVFAVTEKVMLDDEVVYQDGAWVV